MFYLKGDLLLISLSGHWIIQNQMQRPFGCLPANCLKSMLCAHVTKSFHAASSKAIYIGFGYLLFSYDEFVLCLFLLLLLQIVLLSLFSLLRPMRLFLHLLLSYLSSSHSPFCCCGVPSHIGCYSYLSDTSKSLIRSFLRFNSFDNNGFGTHSLTSIHSIERYAQKR